MGVALGLDEPGLAGSRSGSTPFVDLNPGARSAQRRPVSRRDRAGRRQRRYVSRKGHDRHSQPPEASGWAVLQWDALRVSDRWYYKVLQRFAPRIGGRYEVDDYVREQTRAHLTSRDQEVLARGVADRI